jgi:spore maturation protein CgeB
MRTHGYVANRVYDALACGALVLSDDMPELIEFGDAVVRYASEEDLRARVAEWAARPAEAREVAARGRELVLAGHTFAHRVERLLELVESRRAELEYSSRIDGRG